MGYAIAIDGPAGAGKSSIAKRIAESLGFIYVDTGALYRVIGLAVYRKAGRTDDEEIIKEVARDVEVSLDYNEKGQRVYLSGEDVSEEIRKEEISHMASVVSAVPYVRERLLELQRQMAREHDVIMDGRDIGTVILPDADLKIFLTCPAEERAQRRLLQLEKMGLSGDYDKILEDIRLRDERDMNRATSPLKKADDAIEMDTSGYTADGMAERVIRECGLCRR